MPDLARSRGFGVLGRYVGRARSNPVWPTLFNALSMRVDQTLALRRQSATLGRTHYVPPPASPPLKETCFLKAGEGLQVWYAPRPTLRTWLSKGLVECGALLTHWPYLVHR